ncbi:myb domain-containing protein [Cavenderia fasciculata]|uniref:Myb domain-containing protein n=1 Tax=Cavenderia fasciculata TaxID=261658 RepID=F4PYW1_CACFS|nr:myb domain-containing protein [Cavenderia fasciculata]EGG18990.1 myb domain-containing protein [Cavenderia fasciculata]|eukprot:XP_004357469.1 myb domain-containing protein [Cavenderia fasciculata]
MEELVITVDTAENSFGWIGKELNDSHIYIDQTTSSKSTSAAAEYSLFSTTSIRNVEPVGQGFELLWKKLQKKEDDNGIYKLVETNQDESNSGSEDDMEENDEQFQALKQKFKSKEWLKDADHYDIMGLSHLRWRATDQDIKLAYKRMILICHPDKNPGTSDESFKALQKAYDLLSDPKKRRAFDSKEPFDDDLPTERAAAQGDFFKVFGPVFEMNSRWSSVQPAPKLGDIDTPYDKVTKFYDFWYAFKTWREFTFDDDHELDQAESRDERRWMEAQNEKKRSKLKKEEAARILELANMAYKKDPRILKKLKAEEDQREQAKQAKKDAIIKKREEAEEAVRREKQRIIDEERKKKEDEEERKRKKREEESRVTTVKGDFRNVCYAPLYAVPAPPSIEDVELVCAEFTLEELEQLTKQFQSMSVESEKKSLFVEQVSFAKGHKTDREKRALDSKKSNNDVNEKEKVWTEEELAQLAKAIQKYPPGHSNRWEMVSGLIPTRTLKEVINKAKEAQPTKASFAKPVVQQVSAYDKFKSKVGDKVINSELSKRVEPLESVIVETPAAAAETPAPVATTAAVATTTTTTTTPAAAVATPVVPSAAVAKKPAAAATTAAAAASTEPAWSPEEQKLLEEGMQKFDKSLEDRWDQISAHVSTKSKKDCVNRYKYLVTLYKSQAQAK